MLDPKEEQKFNQLRKLAQKLRIPMPEAFLELEVRDKDGNVIQRHRQRSHSWTRNAYNVMFSQFAGKNIDDATFEAGKLSLKRTSGAITAVEKCAGDDNDVDGTTFGYRAGAGIDTFGILVGSGTNAESFEDYALQTPIANATLAHILTEDHSITYVALTLKNTLIRYFNNNSGAPVDVNEVALVRHALAGTSYDFLLSRDKLASTVTVPNTGQLKVTYAIQLTYPS